MAEPNPNLPQVLAFDPDWIKDPVPWVLRFLDRQVAIRAALSRLELQRSINAAQNKALEELTGILKQELNRG